MLIYVIHEVHVLSEKSTYLILSQVFFIIHSNLYTCKKACVNIKSTLIDKCTMETTKILFKNKDKRKKKQCARKPVFILHF